MIHQFDEKDRRFRSTHLTNGMEFVVTFSRLSITLICQLAVLVHARMVIDITEVVVMMIVIIRNTKQNTETEKERIVHQLDTSTAISKT